MPSVEQFSGSPNIIASHYRHAQVELKLMLTGHVHQAIPDIAKAGYAEHWECMSKYGHERFDTVFDKAQIVREGFAELIHADAQNIALGSSVHDLFMRFLSCLDVDSRRKVITTSGEHPSILRQLVRYKEVGYELVALDPNPASTLVERIIEQLDDNTAAVCISSVNYINGHQVLELDTLVPKCEKYNIELFVDAYQSVNVLSFSIADYNLENAFVAGGGAKYCQMGDGNCFMHVPPNREFRPRITGWYGVFDPVLDSPASEPLAYADIPAQRLDGSSCDSLPHFRAAKVFEFFKQQQLTAELLHDINHHQLDVMANAFRALDLNPALIALSTDVEYMGGFISLKTPLAQKLQERMRDIGVICDYCNGYLRLGPAPYLCDEQLRDCIEALHEALKHLAAAKSSA